VTYNLTLTVPQGLTPSCVVTDTLPAGLAFVRVSATNLSPNVTWERPITALTNPANTTVTGNGRWCV